MNEVSLENFRCFRDPQTVRLAPLTLLVGDNSTGKTSFSALIRALWDLAFRERIPDFKEPPYDLGSFDEIVHWGGREDRSVSEFRAGFSVVHPPGPLPRPDAKRLKGPVRYNVTFEKDASAPWPAVLRIDGPRYWIEDAARRTGAPSFRFGNDDHEWTSPAERLKLFWPGDDRGDLQRLHFLLGYLLDVASEEDISPTEQDREEFHALSYAFRTFANPAFASAPVRSQPRRTYDPARITRDSGGDYIPMYLAHLLRSNKEKWKCLKSSIDSFGRSAGLFDEIEVRQLGPGDGDPFQIRIRRYGPEGEKGPLHNVVDVGYGVSQIIPVVTELLRPDAAKIFLLQQPEVHLHPSAQAALGSLFCETAAAGRQIIVETHSDHLIDRARMDIRDGKSRLKPEDVSILYFERGDFDVTIHSLGWDADGNLVPKHGSKPDGYRQFFKTERRRSLGL